MPRPSTATSRTATPMRRWRGIMIFSSFRRLPRCPPSSSSPARLALHHFFASLRSPQLIASGGDCGGYGACEELLVVGRDELGGIGSLGSDFDGDGWSDQVIERAKRRGQGANGNLTAQQFGGDGGGGGLAQWQCTMLRGIPGAKGAAVVAIVRQQRGVDPHAVAAGGCMHGDVDGGAIGVGDGGALVESHVGVGVAQHQSWDAASLEFLAQAAGERDRDVFFQKRAAES